MNTPTLPGRVWFFGIIFMEHYIFSKGSFPYVIRREMIVVWLLNGEKIKGMTEVSADPERVKINTIEGPVWVPYVDVGSPVILGKGKYCPFTPCCSFPNWLISLFLLSLVSGGFVQVLSLWAFEIQDKYFSITK